jgi:hypothetical protein
MKRILLATCLLLGALTGAPAQAQQRIPDEVFYLMPSFGEGMIYIRGQGPAQGKLNICAVDNSLRYIDDDGNEMSSNAENILQVRIDTVTFIRYQNAFVRLHPVTGDTGIAVKRDVRILKDTKVGAYGASSRTSSIQELGTLYTEGMAVELNKSREYPYSASETVFVYKGTDVLIPTRNNLRKMFPEKREEVDAWFKSHRSFPETLEEASALLSEWSR